MVVNYKSFVFLTGNEFINQLNLQLQGQVNCLIIKNFSYHYLHITEMPVGLRV